jgi:hypothetical protein
VTRLVALVAIAAALLLPEVAFVMTHGRFGSEADVLNWMIGL